MPVINNDSKKVVEERKTINCKINNECVKTLIINFMVCFLASYLAITIVFNSRIPRPPKMPRGAMFNQSQPLPPQEEMIRQRQEMMRRSGNMPMQPNGQTAPTPYPARKFSNNTNSRQPQPMVQYPQQMPPAVQYPQQPPMNTSPNVQYGPAPNQ